MRVVKRARISRRVETLRLPGLDNAEVLLPESQEGLKPEPLAEEVYAFFVQNLKKGLEQPRRYMSTQEGLKRLPESRISRRVETYAAA
jgi:hypothetical protein